LQEWDKLTANTNIERDYKGIEKGYELRLMIPKGEYGEVKTESFQDKRVTDASKVIKGMSSAERAALISETALGHESFASEMYAGSIAASLVCGTSSFMNKETGVQSHTVQHNAEAITSAAPFPHGIHSQQ
jgi:hypothetical protein